MPELPDVALFQQVFAKTGLRRQIQRIRVPEPAILVGTSPGGLGRRLADRQFTGTYRRGKNLFVQADDGRHLRFHFGMTGFLQPIGADQSAPEYTRFLIHFEGRECLAMVMPRKLGAVEPIDDLDSYLREAGWGPDALDPTLGFAAFRSLLSDRRGMVKSTLMNQEVIAGLGNVYSDEILFQCRLYPRRPLSELDQTEFGLLFHVMKRVLRTAISRRAQPQDFPPNWLTRHRDPAAKCPRCGEGIGRIKTASRRGYYCPNCQPP